MSRGIRPAWRQVTNASVYRRTPRVSEQRVRRYMDSVREFRGPKDTRLFIRYTGAAQLLRDVILSASPLPISIAPNDGNPYAFRTPAAWRKVHKARRKAKATAKLAPGAPVTDAQTARVIVARRFANTWTGR